MAERIPPYSDDAEKSVLGAALQNQQALDDIIEILSSEDFYRKPHALIFDAMESLRSASQSVDIITVAEELSKRKTLNAAGGRAYLGELAGVVPSPTSAMQYGRIVKEKSMLRQLIESAGEIITSCYEDKQKTDDIISSAEESILEVAKGNQKKEGTLLFNAVEEALNESRKYQESGRTLLGLDTGIPKLNKITQGLQKKDLIILAARPSAGKTALAMNIALNVAIKEKATVMVFSLEMGEKPLSQRMISTVSKVDLSKIKDGSIYKNSLETEKVNDALKIIRDLDIVIDETSGIKVNEMKNKCKRLRQKSGKLDLVIVDYLQLMNTDSGRPENRVQEIAAISQGLKSLAKEMDCPVIVLSQTSREYEKRKAKPMLSDLRDSGAIEQDADLVMFIHNRTEKEDKEEDGFDYNPDTMRELLILKHRNGEIGNVLLAWVGRYQKFAQLSPLGASTYDDSSEEKMEERPF